MKGLASVLAAASIAVGLGACGDEETADSAAGATGPPTGSTITDPPGSIEGAAPPPTGPLDDLVVDRIGELELDTHDGAPEVREVGAEDARSLGYFTAAGDGAVITIARFPTPRRARAYARQYLAVLTADQGFEPSGGREPFDGPRGTGFIVRLDDGAGTDAAVWTTGSLFANALADRASLKAVIAEAPYGSGAGDEGD